MEQKIVLATGVFDILHPGHIHYLEESKKLGDKLFVIVANDKTVIKKKGRNPVLNHFERKKVIESLKVVDKVIVGSENDFIKTAAELDPDIISFGWDQKFDEEKLKAEFLKFGINIEIVHIDRFEEYGSGSIRSKLSS